MIGFMDRENEGVKDLEAEPLPKGKEFLSQEHMGRRAAKVMLDFVYPPTCVHCEAGVDRADLLCAECWRKLRPITRPFCPRLGLPFEFDPGPDGISAEAIAKPPEFRRARSAFLHNGVAKTLVSRLKFGDRPDLAVFCARLMALAGHELFENENGVGRAVLVPVPLHRWRQWQRRYNQSSQLAQALSLQTGFCMDPMIIRRIKSTRPQIGLSAAQRAANVAGAFKMHPGGIERLDGRSVIIVDDVITTGSTIAAMTQVLKKSGVEHIDVISFSRVVIGGDDSL